MQNVEFKAELRDPDLARSICAALGALSVATIRQTDTYYRVPEGRLKRREVAGEPIEWIFYERADVAQPKVSRFAIYTEAEARERFAPHEKPVWAVVKKVRELLLLGEVRIHLDQVEGLGSFLEFEALVTSRQPLAKAQEKVAELRRALAPALGEPIASGYADLLAGGR